MTGSQGTPLGGFADLKEVPSACGEWRVNLTKLSSPMIFALCFFGGHCTEVLNEVSLCSDFSLEVHEASVFMCSLPFLKASALFFTCPLFPDW
ncbi:hypothetical protein JYQ62_37470 [Nostoc sp. UHCC 0702]|nr:hypothetical protein JYQ62_37470 [Nostoc sp. UHCC 0702]